jgi:hypothetical protein
MSVANIITQPETVWVDYTHSRDLDLIVTNWVAARGNFLFYNTMGTSIAEGTGASEAALRIPGVSRGRFEIEGLATGCAYRVYDAAGRFVLSQTGRQVKLPAAGVYFIAVYDSGRLMGTGKTVVVR